jgi:hypothetical protein
MRFVLESWAALAMTMTACGGASSEGQLFSPPHDGGVTESGSTAPDSSTSFFDSGAADTAPIGPADSSAVDTSVSPPPGEDSGPPQTSLPCGAGQPSCPAGGSEVCCITGGVGNLTFQCTDMASCMGVPISCANTAECGSQICCGTETGSGQGTHYVSVQCQPTCNAVRLCDPAANDCPQGETCSSSTLLSGYFVCRM